jgi:hypothetical protein
MRILGFSKVKNSILSTSEYEFTSTFETEDIITDVQISAAYYPDLISVNCYIDGEKVSASKLPQSTSNVGETLKNIEGMLKEYCGISVFADASELPKDVILAASTSRDVTKDMVRVRSSNIWSYKFERPNKKDRNGTLYVQFKNKNGGAGHLYAYYDVPFTVYRSWQSANSKGHYFWQHVRNVYPYNKLTGDKRTKLPHGLTT